MNFGVSRENGEVLLARLDDLGRPLVVDRLSRQEAVTLAVNLIGQATETMPAPGGKDVVPARPDGERFEILEIGDPPPKKLRTVGELMREYDTFTNPTPGSKYNTFLRRPRQPTDNSDQ